jgi:hypothetical protein
MPPLNTRKGEHFNKKLQTLELKTSLHVFAHVFFGRKEIKIVHQASGPQDKIKQSAVLL